MTDTLERTDTSSLEDIAPKCCLIWAVLGTPLRECENVAVWVGFTPCCGNAALVCDDHYKRRLERPFRCGPCELAHEDLIGWRRL